MWFTLLTFLAPITVVGVLSEDGDEICEDGAQRWVNVVPQVGWTTVHGVRAPSALMGKLVKVTGEPVKPPPARRQITNDFTCPPMQARNDWIRSKSGIRYDRSDKAPRYHLAATRFEAFGGLSVRHDLAKDTVEVRLQNDSARALTELTIVLHFEGCYGKPGAVSKRHAVARIEGGQAFTLTTSAREMRDGPRGQEHALAAIQVVSKGDPIFDIDAPVRALGAPIECLERGRRKPR